MSALGQKQTFPRVPFMSALPPRADIAERNAMCASARSALCQKPRSEIIEQPGSAIFTLRCADHGRCRQK
jgi:hypothetical protein